MAVRLARRTVCLQPFHHIITEYGLDLPQDAVALGVSKGTHGHCYAVANQGSER
jgi:hypothetical protein